MVWRRFFFLMVAVATLGASVWAGACMPAQAQERPGDIKVGLGAGGNLLTDAKGLTLHTYDRDQPFRSACNGVCATNWPPLAAPKDGAPVGPFTVMQRDDGTPQWAFRGKPLYRYGRDQAPGEATGDG